MNKHWPNRKPKYSHERRKPTILREEVIRMENGDKNILLSKTAWVFLLLLLVGVLKAAGVVDFELTDSEAEGIALGIVAIVGIVLRLVSSGRVHVLPMR